MAELRRSVVNWLSVIAMAIAAVVVIAATTPSAEATGTATPAPAPRSAGSHAAETVQVGMTRHGTQLQRSVHAMLARRARRHRPDRFTS